MTPDVLCTGCLDHVASGDAFVVDAQARWWCRECLSTALVTAEALLLDEWLRRERIEVLDREQLMERLRQLGG